MNNLESIFLLEKLLEGIHPITGEIFSDDHVCCDPQILRALYRAICALRIVDSENKIHASESTSLPKQKTSNRMPWSASEDAYLRNACMQGIHVDEFSRELCRSATSVKQRLVYLGLASRSILNNDMYADSKHAHQGLPWYPEEDEKLTQLYHSGQTPKAISATMMRSVNSIMARLEKLGLIKSRYEYIAPDSIPF